MRLKPYKPFASEYRVVHENHPDSSMLYSEKWYSLRTNNLGNARGYAETYWDDNGTKVKEVIRSNGKIDFHDANFPSVIEYDSETGNVILEAWYKNDKLSRANGLPARIEYDPETGEIINEEFYVRGVKQVPSQSSDDLDFMSPT